jgi:hypothetical protein
MYIHKYNKTLWIGLLLVAKQDGRENARIKGKTNRLQHPQKLFLFHLQLKQIKEGML